MQKVLFSSIHVMKTNGFLDLILAGVLGINGFVKNTKIPSDFRVLVDVSIIYFLSSV